jgi:putative CRISPR-associated protein (TIGR02620 family)
VHGDKAGSTGNSAMSTITQGDKVLVTGASGFIAVHLCRDLLKKGYKFQQISTEVHGDKAGSTGNEDLVSLCDGRHG